MGRKGHPLAARIKKIMQTDEDVGKIAQATPVMIARALELFLQRMCKNASDVASARKAKTLTCSHVKTYVMSDELMDFLQDTVAKAPDLPPEGEPEAPKAKRQRTTEPKPRAPKGEGKGRTKRESADGAAAATTTAAATAAAATAEEHAEAAAADAEPLQAGAAAAVTAAVAPALQQLKQERGSSSPTAHARPGQGFGGLGAHPFLAARTFGKGFGAAKKGSKSASPKPESPLKQEAAAGALTSQVGQQSLQQLQPQPPHQQQQSQLPPQQQQQPQEQQQSSYSHVAPSLLPGLSAKILAGFATQPAKMEEDDYDDYDS